MNVLHVTRLDHNLRTANSARHAPVVRQAPPLTPHRLLPPSQPAQNVTVERWYQVSLNAPSTTIHWWQYAEAVSGRIKFP